MEYTGLNKYFSPIYLTNMLFFLTSLTLQIKKILLLLVHSKFSFLTLNFCLRNLMTLSTIWTGCSGLIELYFLTSLSAFQTDFCMITNLLRNYPCKRRGVMFWTQMLSYPSLLTCGLFSKQVFEALYSPFYCNRKFLTLKK